MTTLLPPATKPSSFLPLLPPPVKAAYNHRFRWTASQARPEQLTPPGDWRIWLILAGRGWGKTRTGVEDAAWYAITNPGHRISLIAPTAADARDTIVEGQSGLLTAIPDEMIADYHRSLGEIILKNGARFKTFSAEEPNRLRGPQFHRCYADEIAAWSRPDTFDQMMFGLRLGTNPQCVITTTPKPTPLLRGLLKQAAEFPNEVRVTTGSTFDNAANLAAPALAALRRKYEGTRLGRQELFAELLDDMPGALWKRSNIDALRVYDKTAMKRIVVAIDPAVSTEENSDETGIVVAGIGDDDHLYILADRSGKYTPDEWASEAVGLYRLFQAERIIGEANNGGDLIEANIRTVDRNVPFKKVHASRGKAMRAEPIAALYEQKRAHHVGAFPKLEDQMCFPGETNVLTKRGQVPIKSVTTDDFVLTRGGWKKVETSCQTGCSSVFVVIETTKGEFIRCTPDHPIFNAQTQEFVPAKHVQIGTRLGVVPKWGRAGHPSLGVADGITECHQAISDMLRASFCTEKYGSPITDLFHQITIFTTRMRIQEITHSIISKCLLLNSTQANMSCAALPYSIMSKEHFMQSWHGRIEEKKILNAWSAEKNHSHQCVGQNFALTYVGSAIDQIKKYQKKLALNVRKNLAQETQGEFTAVKSVTIKHTLPEKVYNLRVDEFHEFFANGILVHNCMMTIDFDRTKNKMSPDRVDALVWAGTELMLEASPGANILDFYAMKDREDAHRKMLGLPG